MKINIFIPSKLRAGKSKTIPQLKEAIIVVEPQEYEVYRAEYKNKIIQLPENNKGIIYARNFIKKYCEQKGLQSYWQIDDDISYTYLRQGTKLIRKDMLDCILESQKIFEANNITLGSLEYRQYAWSATKELIKNSFCDSFVFMDLTKTSSIYYRENTKEDRDFAMQVIDNNLNTARTTLYSFSAPANGSNEGGLKEIFYDVEDAELKTVQNMVKIWGENICKHIVKKDGRNDLKIYWKNINSKQQTLF